MINIKVIEAAFAAENLRLAEGYENSGHPFTVCTVAAQWLKDNIVRDSKVMGFMCEDNPDAGINPFLYDEGHDFLLVENRWVVDFWFKYTLGNNSMPVCLDMILQPELVKHWYGDRGNWTEVAGTVNITEPEPCDLAYLSFYLGQVNENDDMGPYYADKLQKWALAFTKKHAGKEWDDEPMDYESSIYAYFLECINE